MFFPDFEYVNRSELSHSSNESLFIPNASMGWANDSTIQIASIISLKKCPCVSTQLSTYELTSVRTAQCILVDVYLRRLRDEHDNAI